MNEIDLSLLGWYRTRLAESWQLLEAVARRLDPEMRQAVFDHVAKARALTAAAEAAREQSMIPGFDDL